MIQRDSYELHSSTRRKMMSLDAIRPIQTIRDKFVAAGAKTNTESNGEENGEEVLEGPSVETRQTKRMADPQLPFAAEIEAHNLTHLPYRCWCRHCVRGRGKEMPHTRSIKPNGEVPEFHFDFCFPGDEEPGKYITILVGRMRHTRMTLAAMVPTKSTGEFIAKRVIAYLRECGLHQSKIIVKCDQEPAIMSILDKIRELQVANGVLEPIVPEYSPVKSSQSNGVVERGI